MRTETDTTPPKRKFSQIIAGWGRKIAEWVRKYDDTHNFTCDICGREVFDGERVCEACRKALPWNDGKICPLCGRKVKEAGICLECKEKPLQTDKVRSAFLHEKEAARLVVRYKRGQKYLYRTLAELVLPIIKREFPDAEALVCVPMTKKAQRARGYNQSLVLCEEYARRLDIPVLAVAEKRRETQSQKFLGRAEREKNLEGCFRISDKTAVNGKTLLIIDDTFTTGATVSELAGALKHAGAAKVYAFTATSVENKTAFGKPSSASPADGAAPPSAEG